MQLWFQLKRKKVVLKKKWKNSCYVAEPTNVAEVTKFIENIENEKRSGHDGISNEITKSCSAISDPHLVNFCNECIHLECFPRWLKIAKIIPLHKKGDKSNPENDRPISSRLYHQNFSKSAFDSHGEILSQKRHPYCHAVWFQFQNVMYWCDTKSNGIYAQRIHHNEMTRAYFVDQSKAFDTLDHKIFQGQNEKNGFWEKNAKNIR